MSTVTELNRFRRLHRTPLTTRIVEPRPAASRRDMGALWNDVLATLALVTLASIVVFKAMQIPF